MTKFEEIRSTSSCNLVKGLRWKKILHFWFLRVTFIESIAASNIWVGSSYQLIGSCDILRNPKWPTAACYVAKTWSFLGAFVRVSDCCSILRREVFIVERCDWVFGPAILFEQQPALQTRSWMIILHRRRSGATFWAILSHFRSCLRLPGACSRSET